jgi:hypothetical protein
MTLKVPSVRTPMRAIRPRSASLSKNMPACLPRRRVDRTSRCGKSALKPPVGRRPRHLAGDGAIAETPCGDFHRCRWGPAQSQHRSCRWAPDLPTAQAPCHPAKENRLDEGNAHNCQRNVMKTSCPLRWSRTNADRQEIVMNRGRLRHVPDQDWEAVTGRENGRW